MQPSDGMQNCHVNNLYKRFLKVHFQRIFSIYIISEVLAVLFATFVNWAQDMYNEREESRTATY